MTTHRRYQDLEAGDCIWWCGALHEITKVFPPAGIVIRFEGKVVRESTTYDLGEITTLSGLSYADVQIEVGL